MSTEPPWRLLPDSTAASIGSGCNHGRTSRAHCGHVFHTAGRAAVTGATVALVDIPDGAMSVAGSGRITFCGSRAEVAAECDAARLHDHRPDYLLPGSGAAHVHFPQAYAGACSGGGRVLERLNQLMSIRETSIAEVYVQGRRLDPG